MTKQLFNHINKRAENNLFNFFGIRVSLTSIQRETRYLSHLEVIILTYAPF